MRQRYSCASVSVVVSHVRRPFHRLSDRYQQVAPDYSGFGHRDWPDLKKFDYTSDHIASAMNGFAQAMGLSRFSLYMQDYGGPVGFSMALAHPERLQALIVQNAVSHNEGLGAIWAIRRPFLAEWYDSGDPFRAINKAAMVRKYGEGQHEL